MQYGSRGSLCEFIIDELEGEDYFEATKKMYKYRGSLKGALGFTDHPILEQNTFREAMKNTEIDTDDLVR